MSSRSFLLLLAIVLVVTLPVAYAELPMPKPQESFAPYWTAEPGWETELQLRNNLASGALTVTPVLRLANGNEIPLDPVTISSNAAASIQSVKLFSGEHQVCSINRERLARLHFAIRRCMGAISPPWLRSTCMRSRSATTSTLFPCRTVPVGAVWRVFGGSPAPE